MQQRGESPSGFVDTCVDRELELLFASDIAGNELPSMSLDLAILDADEVETDLQADLSRLRGGGAFPKIALLTSNYSGVNVVRLAMRSDLVLPKPLDAATFAEVVGWLLHRVDPVTQFAREYRLSPREASLLRLSMRGRNNDEIAATFGCSRATISTYWNRVFRKTGVSGQREILALLFSPHHECKVRRVPDSARTVLAK